MFASSQARMNSFHIYYGTASANPDHGIQSQTLDAATGKLGKLKRVGDGPSAGFQAISKDGSRLYSIFGSNEVAIGVRAYQIDAATGELTLINEQAVDSGKLCYIGLDQEEKFLLAASYGDAVISIFPLAEDGSIKPQSESIQSKGASKAHPQRQEAAHTHSIYFDPTNEYILVCDLGKDQIAIYQLDKKTGKLRPGPLPAVDTDPGNGPRHMAFHPSGKWTYVINELSGSITHYDWQFDCGVLIEQDTISTLPKDFDGLNTCAEVIVSQDGRFLYAANRGHDSIAIYAINQGNGSLKLIQHEPTRGRHPRHFNIDPSGDYMIVANRDSDNAAVFKVDRPTGKIEYTGQEIEVPQAICVQFAPAKP